MRYLILTDIHANLEALETCLSDAKPRGYDQTLVLGDLVGYGADPNAVVERVRDLHPAAIVRGNHDKVVLGLDQADGFNAVARSAAVWMLAALTSDNREWVAELPQGPHTVDDLVEICHGSPYDEDAYIFDELDGLRAINACTRPVCFFGHTHHPITFELANGTFSAGRGLWAVDRTVVDGAVNGSGWFTIISAWFSGLTDRNIVDGLVNLVGWIVQESSLAFRRFQTGLVQNYALLMLFGIFAFVGIYLFVR